MEITQAMRQHPVIVIYRGQTTQQCVALTAELVALGYRAFEVTLNSAEPYDAIVALRAEFGEMAAIGAGTVLSAEQVDRAAEAGAGFVISPDTNAAVIGRTKQRGLVSIPGAFTPTEIVRATSAGADLVKVFPIRPVGADYIRQLRGPLPDVGYVATGGVGPELATECFAAGCVGVGVGIQLFGEDALAGDTAALREAAGRFSRAAGVDAA